MRILNGVFFVAMILFAAVQYNDPDGVYWALIYGVGALWCGVAAFRAHLFASQPAFGLYALSFLGVIGAVVYYWPTTPNWWMEDVWWETETAREGMGVMILAVAVIVAGVVALRARRA